MATPEPQAVLVVDDNELARYGKSRILRRAGFDVSEAATGEEAMRSVAARPPRLVVLDVNLPDIDGWEICRRIKADPATASVLVLQVSATYVREEDTVRALEGGADACLTEPIEGPVLVATVKALLRARQAEDALRDALAREQAAREAAEAANRTKDEFLAALSHELRSPLTAILTWVTLLRGSGLDEERKARALDTIERNTRLQAKLIDDLLDVSRIISGKMRLDVALVDLVRVVEDPLEAVRPAAEAKGVALEALVDAGIGPVLGDAGRLQQVVWNLLSNAVKFTPKGGRVRVSLGEAGSQARIRVSDSGRGIEPEFLPHVFERFRQADSSTTRAEGGLGLGLAIVRHLVELHGGTVEVESPGLGRGATFTVWLPLPAVQGPPAAREGAPTAHTEPRALAGVRVLVVDDDPDARESIGAVLEHAGAAVTTASSVREALAAVARSAPGVVLSDIAMPCEDGFALVRELRRRHGGVGGCLPVIALTGYASPADEARVLTAGYDVYLTKPVEPATLVAAIARFAGRAPG